MELDLKILVRLKQEMEALMTQLTLRKTNPLIKVLIQCVSPSFALNYQGNRFVNLSVQMLSLSMTYSNS